MKICNNNFRVQLINNVCTYNSPAGIRKFSITSPRYQDKKCDCCSDYRRNFFTDQEKAKLKVYGEEFASNNKVPVLDQEIKDKILSEKAVDIAAAYKNNPQGLEDRKQEAYTAFMNIKQPFIDYFVKKYDKAIEKLNNENMEAGKIPVCKKLVTEHLYIHGQDKEKVQTSHLSVENTLFGCFSKDAYKYYTDSMSKHYYAKQLIDTNGKSIARVGNPDSIDKDFYKNELSVVKDPSSSNDNIEENAETENSSKRKKSLEELNPDSVKKPKRDDSDSDSDSKGGGIVGGLGGVVGGSAGTNNAITENGSAGSNNPNIEKGSVETNDAGTEKGSVGFFENIIIRLFLGLPSGFEMVLEVNNNINMFS